MSEDQLLEEPISGHRDVKSCFSAVRPVLTRANNMDGYSGTSDPDVLSTISSLEFLSAAEESITSLVVDICEELDLNLIYTSMCGLIGKSC